MICRIVDIVYRGDAVSLPQDIRPAAILDAISSTDAINAYPWTGANQNSTASSPVAITIECPPPSPVHDHLGYIHPEMGLRMRTALAKAGRTRGIQTPYDEELASVRETLESITVSESADTDHRERVAATGTDLQSLQEDVAAARGRLQACRDHGLDTTEPAAELEEAIRKLSEYRTEATAATQEQEHARMNARERRDELERKFRLEDRAANLERKARQSLVDQLRGEFTDNVQQVPGTTVPDDPFSASPPVGALAIARLASLDAPLVLSGDRFESATAAAAFLDAPIIQI